MAARKGSHSFIQLVAENLMKGVKSERVGTIFE